MASVLGTVDGRRGGSCFMDDGSRNMHIGFCVESSWSVA